MIVMVIKSNFFDDYTPKTMAANEIGIDNSKLYSMANLN